MSDYKKAANELRKLHEGFGVGHTVSSSIPGLSDFNGCMSMKCGLGYIVVTPTGDPGEYSEFSIDLLTDDGRLLQLSVVGMNEYECDERCEFVDKEYRPMHVYTYDGMNEGVIHATYVTVNDDSHWYE